MKNKTVFRLEKSSLSEAFNNKTKIKKFDIDENFEYPLSWKIVHFKEYPRFKKQKLKITNLSNINFQRLLKQRYSKREFAKSISFSEVSNILYWSGGMKKDFTRFYPSAGGRYPLEIYIVALNVDSLESGIYHFNIKKNLLELILKGYFKDEAIRLSGNQEWIKDCGIVISISAVFGRTEIKYGERGYRYVLMEAGHLAQNLYLVSEALNLGCCAIGGFLDDEINKLLDIDGKKESVIYLCGIGKKM